ncbi:ActR/PrrA/RegA family redox response regulator transcription factor [Oceanibacterium hippocampi]|uniref:Photosynthetic apparatus regulatory protein RegA n=1 Tax=Oceanibacterium hippocampi TaxID=745714 RepID=A0A1Y5RN19_9PROT|nr:ActR/PrrA/RegA family redox response regulator transcription factor [Oceanibacterium hippocampi]SLN21277.1 Photosynthetic apparatus regulatory protein RegA [Oceanibacterium hippocampi]
MSEGKATDDGAIGERRLLIVDDDEIFLRRLGRAMERREFTVALASSVEEALGAARREQPDFAVIDLKLGQASGLDMVPELRAINPSMRIVMLTGYGNIATTVAAIKAGAVDYLAKPADADAIEAALLESDSEMPVPPENPMSADRVRWEHIQRVFELCDRNVSETARRLNMHRRTLQRILAKHSPR